jgi:hypothetical protein
MSSTNYGATLAERLQSPVTQWLEAWHSFARSLRVAMPATVVSFNATNQTVVVQPAITELPRSGGVLKVTPLPQLVDVPVVLPRAGGFTLTMPIQAGDECLVVFADSCIDAWWQSGGQQNQLEQRRHHLADAFAIVGAWNQQRVLSNYSTSSAQLRSDNGSTVIDVAASQVTVTAQTVQVNASGTATVQGGTVNVTGSSQVNISGNGNTTVEGRNFLNHTHKGVQAGTSTSGPVV